MIANAEVENILSEVKDEIKSNPKLAIYAHNVIELVVEKFASRYKFPKQTIEWDTRPGDRREYLTIKLSDAHKFELEFALLAAETDRTSCYVKLKKDDKYLKVVLVDQLTGKSVDSLIHAVVENINLMHYRIEKEKEFTNISDKDSHLLIEKKCREIFAQQFILEWRDQRSLVIKEGAGDTSGRYFVNIMNGDKKDDGKKEGEGVVEKMVIFGKVGESKITSRAKTVGGLQIGIRTMLMIENQENEFCKQIF